MAAGDGSIGAEGAAVKLEDVENDEDGVDEDDDEEDDPETRRRRAAAVERQQRLLAGSKHWVGDGASRKSRGAADGAPVDEGEEGGDDDGSEMGDGPALAVLQQGVMVADSTYMFTPSAMLPAPQAQLVDYQWQRRMARQRAEAEQGGDPQAASKVRGYPISLM